MIATIDFTYFLYLKHKIMYLNKYTFQQYLLSTRS
jgi:hypothetical protein